MFCNRTSFNCCNDVIGAGKWIFIFGNWKDEPFSSQLYRWQNNLNNFNFLRSTKMIRSIGAQNKETKVMKGGGIKKYVRHQTSLSLSNIVQIDPLATNNKFVIKIKLKISSLPCLSRDPHYSVYLGAERNFKYYYFDLSSACVCAIKTRFIWFPLCFLLFFISFHFTSFFFLRAKTKSFSKKKAYA